MAKYFECDALIAQMRAFKCGDEEYDEGIETAVNVCAIADAADVRPVRRGQWKPFDLTYGRSIYSCTSCGEFTEVPTEMGTPMYRYCPNCGSYNGGDADG